MEGDFKDICLFIIHKISPNPSFPKRGITGLDQKTIYKQTLINYTTIAFVLSFLSKCAEVKSFKEKIFNDLDVRNQNCCIISIKYFRRR